LLEKRFGLMTLKSYEGQKRRVIMEKKIVMEFPKQSDEDLYLNVFGHSITEPLHKAGPAVKSFYLIHFILEGKGTFHVNNTDYKLSAGQGFLIEPDNPSTYISDEVQPWTYIWVGFSGTTAKELLRNIGLSQQDPVFTCTEGDRLKKYVFDMLNHNTSSQADQYRLKGMLYLFLSVIANAQKDKAEDTSGNTYVNHAIYYIQNHYSMPVKIEEISDYVGINRSYFSDLFRKYTGMSPIKYLQNFRITKAEHMLTITELPIESIALSCGYQSAESFHKIFRQKTGMSPKTYRQKKRNRTLTNQETMKTNKPEYIDVSGDEEL
jgi:AraC-like DNA-binding protein